MRKELIGICLVFLIIFTLASLLSYSHLDPSIHHVIAAKKIYNLFGLIGAHISGFLIGMFGLGSFWIPILLVVSTFYLFKEKAQKTLASTLLGGFLLLIVTGSLFALYQDHYVIFGQKFHAGGMVGFALRDFFRTYAGIVGGTLILLLFFIIGMVLALGFSPTRFFKSCYALSVTFIKKVRTGITIWKARKENKKEKKTKKAPVTLNKPASRKSKKDTFEIKIQPPPPKPAQSIPKPKQEEFDFMKTKGGFQLPGVKFLNDPPARPDSVDDENLRAQSKLLEKKLIDFGVQGEVVAVFPGPVITTFEYKPAPGVKINKIVNLTDDLALALRAISIRIVAPIPGKAAIGIEIPNAVREHVCFKEIVTSEHFHKSKSRLTVCLGKDIVGNPVSAELDKMPHLLIAGATGAGKSVGLNAMIASLLYKATPQDVKMIMVDPKRIELSVYDGIPHLITPVVTDMKKATNALFWAVKEMERRYELLSEFKCRNITQFNTKIAKEKPEKDEEPLEPLPFIVIIIDELADLMMVSSRDVEVALTRLAQMARAAGIHLVLATQRPSVDVLTGVIKANFPTRISFQVSSKTDSRTIIDSNGAEHLLGMGDMLFLPPGTAKLQRIHGAFISEEELNRIIQFLKDQKPPEYKEEILQPPVKEENNGGEEEHDEKYDEAIALVTKTRQASISMVQRHLRIGYNRAARIIEVMEQEGIVGPSDGAKPREVLVRGYDDIS